MSLILSLLISLLTAAHPKDVTGKWVVDHVETENIINSLPPMQKQRMGSMMKAYFKNAIFILQPDHKCTVNVKIPSMPKINYWNYDTAKGIINLSVDAQDESKIMMIEVTEQNGSTFFSIKESTTILRVHKTL